MFQEFVMDKFWAYYIYLYIYIHIHTYIYITYIHTDGWMDRWMKGWRDR